MSLFSRVFKERRNSQPNNRWRSLGFAYRPRLEVLETRDLPATLLVTTASGDPNVAGSLPWAINRANLSVGLDYVLFNISGPGVHVISVNQQLWVNDQIVIDGASQPGYAGSPLISVQGSAATPGIFILNAGSSGSTIQGLDIYSYSSNGITILRGSDFDWIQNNWIGYFVDGAGVHLNTARFAPPQFYTIGLAMQANNTTIRWNTISGNYNGIAIGEDVLGTWSGTPYSRNGVQFNYVGTNPGGTSSAGYGNLSNAMFFGEGAQGNWLGPTNVLSGNGTNAVELLHSSVSGNVIFSDMIGTDISGNFSIPNGWAVAAQHGGTGVLVANGAHGNAIGGPWGGNIISGNGAGGVALGSVGSGPALANWVQFNVFGLNKSQTQVLGSQNVGVSVDESSQKNVIQGNIIAGQTGNGIVLDTGQANDQTIGNDIEGNWLGESQNGRWFLNGGWGISLNAYAGFTWIAGNFFGANALGTIYVSPLAYGNHIA